MKRRMTLSPNSLVFLLKLQSSWDSHPTPSTARVISCFVQWVMNKVKHLHYSSLSQQLALFCALWCSLYGGRPSAPSLSVDCWNGLFCNPVIDQERKPARVMNKVSTGLYSLPMRQKTTITPYNGGGTPIQGGFYSDDWGSTLKGYSRQQIKRSQWSPSPTFCICSNTVIFEHLG